MNKIEVIAGPMYSGKSEELIRRATRAQIAGKKVLAIKPVIDDRYSLTEIVSHSGSRIDAVAEPNIWQLEKWAIPVHVVVIDEAQFFPADELVEQVKIISSSTHVIIAGLDMTYRMEPFGAMPTLMAIAESVTKLSAVCHKCGEDAFYTQRLIDGKPASFEGDTIQVGGLDTYEARCRRCFERG